MAEDSSSDILIAFVSAGLPDEAIVLRGVHGREAISQLFEYRLILTRDTPFTDDELDLLLGSHCGIAMGPQPSDTVHGLLSEIRLLDHTRDVRARYLATLVPTASLLTLSQSCRVYQDLTVAEIIASVLSSYGMEMGKGFELRLHEEMPSREYVVQYMESDWDFLCRWMEHEGLFYWFEHGAGGERLIIADHNDDATRIGDPYALQYRERNNLHAGGEATVWGWQLEQRRVPARVAVLDYNYRTPHLPLAEVADVVTQYGFGTVVRYGEHFKTPDEGKRVAKLRAEGIGARRRTYAGHSDCPRLRVGHTFELENHHDAAHDGEYLITAIEHRVGYPVRLGDAGDVDLGEDPERYRCRFEAVERSTPYRPPKVTPWPRVSGILHAHVAGDTGGEHAELDGMGRYKIRLPFDVHGPEGSGTSRWVRMAQPYAGGGYGQHFPLHKGTEVLLAHVDGDPDRPIIVGAVPNPHTQSPATSANATQSVIQTAAGIRIEMEDLQS